MRNNRLPRRSLLLLLNTLIIILLFAPVLTGGGPLPDWPLLIGLYMAQGLLALAAMKPVPAAGAGPETPPPSEDRQKAYSSGKASDAVDKGFLAAAFLCSVAAFGIYWFSLDSFFHEDDVLHMGKVLPWMYGTRSLGDQLASLPSWLGEYFRPLVGLFWTAGVKAAGLSPAPYHAAVILLHAGNGLVIASITRLLGGSAAAGVIAGLVFVCFPVHTETVSHLAAGFDNQPALLLYLLAFRAFLKKSESSGSGVAFSTASLLLFLLALLSKEMAVTLPLVIFLHTVITGARNRSIPSSLGRGLATMLPYAAPLAVYAVLRLYFLEGAGGMISGAGENLNFSLRPDMFVRTLAFTLPRFILFPINAEVYGRHDLLFALFGTGAALIVFAGSFIPARHRVYAVFLAAWSVVVLLPVYNIAHISPDFLNSRFLFFSAAPVSILFGFFLAGSPRSRASTVFRYSGAAAWIILLALTARTNNLPRKSAAEDCEAVVRTIRASVLRPPGDCRLFFVDMPGLKDGVNRFVYPDMLTSALFLYYPEIYSRVSEVGFLNGGTGENYGNSYPVFTPDRLGKQDFVFRWLPGERRLEEVTEQLEKLFSSRLNSGDSPSSDSWFFEMENLDGWRLAEGSINHAAPRPGREPDPDLPMRKFPSISFADSTRDKASPPEVVSFLPDPRSGDLLLISPSLAVSTVQAAEFWLIVSESPGRSSNPNIFLDWTTPERPEWSIYRSLSGTLEPDSSTGNLVLDISCNAPFLLDGEISRIRMRISDFGPSLSLQGIALAPKSGKGREMRDGLVFAALARGKNAAVESLVRAPGGSAPPLVEAFLRAIRVFEDGDPGRATKMFEELEKTTASGTGEMSMMLAPLACAGARLCTAVSSTPSTENTEPGEDVLAAAIIAPHLGVLSAGQIAENFLRLYEGRTLAEFILAEYPGDRAVLRCLAGIYERLDRFDLAQPLWRRLFLCDPAGGSSGEALEKLLPERNRWKIFRHAGGFSYTMKLNGDYAGDDESNNHRSILRLYENGKPLGPAHAPHSAIARSGGGCFSHWKDEVYFSTSDNSDPNENGGSYYLQPDPSLFMENLE